MSTVTNAYADNSIHNMFIDKLKDDGVLCDSSIKSYDEQGTYEGGTGSRKSFKAYNDKITLYHKALKILTGERRANIYEAIPVIDYMIPDNSGFDYYYPISYDTASSKGVVQTDRIIHIPEKADKSPLELLEEEDEFTINRVLRGDEISEQFFNTRGLVTKSANIQTTYATDSSALTYEGIKNKRVVVLDSDNFEKDYEEAEVSIRQSESYYVAPSGVSQRIEFNPSEVMTDCVLRRDESTGNIYYYDPYDNIVVYGGLDGDIPGYATALRVNNKQFIYKTTDPYYQVAIEKGDLALIIPKSAYSDDITRILVFKYDTTDDDYKVFIIFAENFTPAESMDKLEASDTIDTSTTAGKLIAKTQILTMLNNYISISKDYFASASGLMNGLFSEPCEYDSSALASANPTGLCPSVTKWRFIDETTEAAASGAVITPGTKYFGGHIMHRGNFLQEPLKLTKSDTLTVDGTTYHAKCSGISPYLEDDPINITGKAGLYYRTLKEKKFVLIDAYQEDKTLNEWISGFDVHQIDSVITKSNYGSTGFQSNDFRTLLGLDQVTWQDQINASYKFQEEDGTPCDFDKVMSYIRAYNNIKDTTSEGDECYYIDLTDEDTTSYENDYYSDSTVTIFSKRNKRSGEETRVDETYYLDGNGTREDLLTDYNKMFYVKYTSHHNEDGTVKGIDAGFENPIIHMITPLEAFSLEGEVTVQGGGSAVVANGYETYYRRLRRQWRKSKKTYAEYSAYSYTKNHLDNCILLWPEYNKYYPENLLIISHDKLDLEEYNAENPSASLCTFVKDGKAVAFKVDSIQEICPSTMQHVKVKLPPELYSSNSARKSETVEVDCPNGLNTYETYTDNNKSTRTEHPDSDYDCYVYILSAVTLSYKDLTLYDQDDCKINMSSYMDMSSLLPVAYPSTFFKTETTTEEDGTKRYNLAESSLADLYDLKGASIIVGYPSITKMGNTLQPLTTAFKSEISLAPMAYMFGSGNNSLESFSEKVNQKCLYKLISNMVLSDGTSPLKVMYLSDCLKGLLDLETMIQPLSNLDYEINTTDNIILKPEYFTTYMSRLHTDDTVPTGSKYTATYGGGVQVALGDKITTTYPLAYGSSVKGMYKLVDGNYVACGDDEVADGTTYYYTNTEFYDKVVANLKDDTYGLKLSSTEPTGTRTRYSWERMYNLINGIFDGEYTADECTLLDNLLGNDAQPILNIGTYMYLYKDDVYTEENIIAEIPINSAIINATQTTKELVAQCFVDTAMPIALLRTVPDNLMKENVYIVDSKPDTAKNSTDIYYYVKPENKEYYYYNDTWNEYTSTCKAIKYLKDNYKNYYTSTSVDAAFNETTGKVDKSGLVINYTASSVVQLLTQVLSGAADLGVSTSVYVNWRDTWVNSTTGVKWTEAELVTNLKLNSTEALPAAKDEQRTIINNWLEEVITLKCNAFESSANSYFAYPTRAAAISYIEGDGEELKDNFAYWLAKKSGSDVIFTYTVCAPDYDEDTAEFLPPYATETIYQVAEVVVGETIPEGKYYIKDASGNYVLASGTFQEGVTYYTILYNIGDVIYKLAYWPSSRIVQKSLKEVEAVNPDIRESALEGIESFIKESLFGTNGDYTSGIKYIAGEDDSVVGNDNGLYYKRYQMLNNRMNKTSGSLYNAARLLQTKPAMLAIDQYDQDYVNSYSRFIDTIPISKSSSLSFMPEQEGVNGSVQMGSKFYYAAEMSKLASEISDKCILTCTKCPVRDNCPFYDENELLKLYCTPVETLDFWVKDNTLDMIYYEKDDEGNYTSPNIEAYEPDTTNPSKIRVDEDGNYVKKEGSIFDVSKLQMYHLPYGRIKEKYEYSGAPSSEATKYLIRDIDDLTDPVNGELYQVHSNTKNEASTEFKNLDLNMNWLFGGRYGTVERNTIKDLVIDDEYNVYDYRYLFDAVYLSSADDSNSDAYVQYYPSSNNYEVTFKKDDTIYHGTTKIKLPGTLRMFTKASANDDIYLVSDDTVDSDGNAISPVIYLNKLKDLQWTFGINTDPTMSKQSSSDSTIYASDIAQWAMNVYKGNMHEDPIGDTGPVENPVKDTNDDRDQIWMSTIKKKVYTTNSKGESVAGWISIDGRPREDTGYQEVLMSTDNPDASSIVSGKPPVANYQNFLTKISIKMYDVNYRTDDQGNNTSIVPDSGTWLIKFLKYPETAEMTTELHNKIEEKKRILSLMKTNLRLVAVRTFE